MVTFRVRGVDSSAGMLRAVAARAEDLRPVWPMVGNDIAQALAQQFATAGAFGGQPWAPLKPDYLQWKVSRGYPATTLVRTGKMREAFTSRPMGVERYARKSAVFGSGVDYYQFHHTGTSKMPRRAVLYRNTRLLRAYRDRVSTYITTGRVG